MGAKWVSERRRGGGGRREEGGARETREKGRGKSGEYEGEKEGM